MKFTMEIVWAPKPEKNEKNERLGRANEIKMVRIEHNRVTKRRNYLLLKIIHLFTLRALQIPLHNATGEEK